MLNRVSSGWVQYKLDRGVDHVLIDEAQDSSPRQWDIVANIISEFTAGAGAREGLNRTVFAVGDEKQTIFSFQGAAPHEFDARRRELHRRFTAAGLKCDPVAFTYSFRSGATILHSVDHVFRDPSIYKSIHSVEIGHPLHNALADAGPSVIELWDLAEADDRLNLTEHIAIIDLMNLADALLLPQDDLALAVALKSPLFGLDDDDLFAIAPQRTGSLRDALEAHAATSSKLQQAND